MKMISLGVTLAALAVAGTAHAADAAPDRRGDQTMTRADAQTRAARMFDRLDANHDGKLDQADKDARRAAMFDQLDANHDGQISRAEFMAARPGWRDRDGARAGGPDSAGQGQHMGGHHHGGMGMHGRMGGMMARMADANRDGVVTRDEFIGAAMQRFDSMDANKDGSVSSQERQAARAAMRQRMRDRAGGGGMAPPPRLGN